MLRGRVAGWEAPGEEAHLGSGEGIRSCQQLLFALTLIWDGSWLSEHLGLHVYFDALREAGDFSFAA